MTQKVTKRIKTVAKPGQLIALKTISKPQTSIREILCHTRIFSSLLEMAHF